MPLLELVRKSNTAHPWTAAWVLFLMHPLARLLPRLTVDWQQPPAKWDLGSHLRLQDYLAGTAAKDPFRTVPLRHQQAIECDVCAALTGALSVQLPSAQLGYPAECCGQAATQSTRKSNSQMQTKVSMHGCTYVVLRCQSQIMAAVLDTLQQLNSQRTSMTAVASAK